MAFLLLAGCQGASVNQGLPVSSKPIPGQKVTLAGGEYTNITVNQLQEMFDNKDFILVNVHIPFEGNLPNTDLSIPYDEIDQHLNQLPAEKDARIVLYCRSGRMSGIAAETLVSLGYTNLANVKGGMVAWEEAGLSLEGD